MLNSNQFIYQFNSTVPLSSHNEHLFVAQFGPFLESEHLISSEHSLVSLIIRKNIKFSFSSTFSRL